MGLLGALGKTARIAIVLARLAIRLTWMCTIGPILAIGYLLLGFIMSPFGMLFGYSGRRSLQTAKSIWTLTPHNARQQAN